jgi:hypothetical protein
MKTIENDKYRLVIEHDENPVNPRELCEYTKMICFNKKYNLL